MHVDARRRFFAGVAVVAAALAPSACSYSSAWMDPTRAQQAAAQRAAPAEIHATPAQEGGGEAEVPPSPSLRVLRLRARATPQYAAQVMDWPRQLEVLLEDVNRVLGPTLNARLVLAETATWVPRVGEEDLSATVEELVSADPGDGVDWVVGLVGSVPRFELSFHQLGMGRMSSKHFVLRAMNDAREHDAIMTSLSRLPEQERTLLYRARRRHKATAVFLHELGHTLGVPHEVDARTVMSPRYDPGIQGFSDAAAEMMRLALAHRLDPTGETEAAYARALSDLLQRTSASWVPAERDQALAQLAAVAQAPTPTPRRGRSWGAAPAAPAPQAATAAPGAPIGADQVATLTEVDRATLARAIEDQRAGRLREAWDRAKPLFTAYPDVYPVQDLRCQLAMAMGGSMDAVHAECDPLMALTMHLPSKRKQP